MSRRLNLFVKGNLDVRDSLLHFTVDGQVQWNGLNEVLRKDFPGVVARIRHETCTRSDALLQTDGQVPAELLQHNLPVPPYTLESQFSRRIFESGADVVILSIQPELMNAMLRHRRDGYLFYPHDFGNWPDAEQEWARAAFEYALRLDAASSMENLAQICRRIRSVAELPILIYNLSAVVPEEGIHCHQNIAEALSTRFRRFNVALLDLSRSLGISVVDVDAIVARGGADRLKLDPVHLTADGYRLVAAEVARILCDLGCFD